MRQRRPKPRHRAHSPASKVVGNLWLRVGFGVAAITGLMAAAFGSGTATKVPRAAPGVVMITAVPANGDDNLLTVVMSVAAAPASPSPSLPPNPLQGVIAQASALASDGIPSIALAAYKSAATREDVASPACGISWPLLAAIGRVESDHGRAQGAVLYTDGESKPHIIGRALNGVGTALIRDTDHGVLDGDKVYDHAVGPMQFIPTTWARYGVDARGGGTPDPFNIYDAAAAAAHYLCNAGGNLTTLAGQTRALHAYNDSDTYEALVLAMETEYAAGAGVVVPTVPAGPLPADQHPAPVPPADPGTPPGLQSSAPPVAGPTPSGAVPSSTASRSSAPPVSSSSAAPPTSTPSSPTPAPSPSGTPPSDSPTPTPPSDSSSPTPPPSS